MKVEFVDIFGDSQLVINQVNEIFKCLNKGLLLYYIGALHLMNQFKTVSMTHVPRHFNQETDEKTLGFKRIGSKQINQEVLRKFLPPLEERGLIVEVDEIQIEGDDWR